MEPQGGRLYHTHTLLTAEEEAGLLEKAQAGDRGAVEELVEHNQALVVHVAQRFYFEASDRDLGDLIQWGSIGLLRAIEKWEPGRSGKFSTYAVWWIRQ